MPDFKNEILIFITTTLASGITGVITWFVKGKLDRRKVKIELQNLEQQREQKAIEFRDELISKVELLQEHQYQLQSEIAVVTLENVKLKAEMNQLRLKNQERDEEIKMLTKQIEKYHEENIKLQNENQQLKLNLNKKK